ncbi:hypothetical protein SHIRM173S_00091 [Streptomyces hirsutus]
MTESMAGLTTETEDEHPPVEGHEATTEAHEATILLERARAEVDPVLRAAIGSLPGPLRRIARYHFGWEHADGTPATGGSGKAIRPALVLAAASALGGPAARATAVRAAAAVELVHNFTLLHDDVMDRDTTRRHRPTAWTVFGDADAILAGDALHALALRLLAEDTHRVGRGGGGPARGLCRGTVRGTTGGHGHGRARSRRAAEPRRPGAAAGRTTRTTGIPASARTSG